jgi:hypothetical protein
MRGFVCFLSLLPLLVFAQPDSTWVRYQSSYPFRDGLYYGFRSFRENRPDVPKQALTTVQGQPVTDLRQTNGKVMVPDSSGEPRPIMLDRLWGFCDNGVIHVRAGNGFSRIGLMGSIGHLVFDATYRDLDPYGYYGTVSYTVEEQRFLDMDTGDLLPVTAAGLYAVLQRDEVLKEEFNAVPKRKRKNEVLFLFMRRYNDRHPLYFPPG